MTASKRLREVGFTVRDLAPFAIRPPITWSADPHGDRNWRFQLNALYPVLPFLQAHEDTGSKEALAIAVALIGDWISFNVEENRPNDFKWYDMATGIRAAFLAYVIDRICREDAHEEHLERFLVAADAHVAKLMKPKFLASGNHALFQLGGLAGLCNTLPALRKCRGAATYAKVEFERLVGEQFAPDGIHLEHSPAYHMFAQASIKKILDTGWLNTSEELLLRLERAEENVAWLTRPDKLFPAVGDSSGGPESKYLRALNGTTRSFSDGGYAVLRHPGETPESDGYVFFTVAHHSRAHKHHDSMSFEWFDKERPILIDSGKYGYESDASRDYVRSTRAHNTLEIDGGNLDQGDSSGASVLTSGSSGGLYFIWAEKTHEDFATDHLRIVLYHPGRWLAVYDSVSSREPHTFDQWFHLAGDASANQGAQRAEATWPDETKLYISELLGSNSPRVVRGQTNPRMQGWYSPAYRKLSPNSAIAFRRSGSQAEFLTVLRFGAPAVAMGALDTEPGRRALCWLAESKVEGAIISTKNGKTRMRPCTEKMLGAEPDTPR